MRKRLLAMFLVLVLAMSNLGGISVAHAEEASSPKVTAEPEGGGGTEVDNTVLNVKTVDKDGNPVAGVELMLEAVSEWGENVPLGTTDDTGKYSYEIEWEYDAYLLKPTEESGFSCANPAEVFIDMTMDDFVSYVSTVNGAAYTGVVVLVVEEGETSADPVIKSVELVDKFVSEEGGTVAVKVKGANLPDKLYYSRQYVADDGYGGTMPYTVDWTGVEAEAEGTAKEKTINVPIDSASTYPNALAWIVKVGLSSDISNETYKASGELAVGMPEGIAIDETIFPDEEFLKYVLENIDANEDGYLQQEEIDETTSIDFDWGTYEVMDLTGIAYFANLEYLNCAFTGISELDLSANVNLKYLECSYNEGLEVLDVSKNVLLEELHCYETPIAKLDVTKNTKLVRLDCNNTNISKLDVTKNTKLFALNVEGTKLKSIDVRKNKELYEVYVSFTDISKLDISKNKKLGQVRFEDTNITSMDFSNNPELVAVRCANTGIKKLDFSKNPKMYEIFCFGTKVSSLNLTKMKGLHTLECHDTNISKLNVTNNPGLVGLSCGGTKITNLDVTKNPELKRLECNDTKITNLDLSNNKKLDTLNVSNTAIEELKKFDASMLPALEELYCNNAGIESLDLSSNLGLYSLDCGNNAITELDLTAIEGLWFMDTISPQNVEAEFLLEEGKAVLDMKEYVADLSKIEVAESDAYTYDAETGIVTFDKAGEIQVAYTYDHGYSELDAMEVNVSAAVKAIPEAPETAQAVLSGGHDDVEFSWDASENAEGYLVSYKKASSETWSKAVDVTDTTYKKKNLTDNITYNFKVVPYTTYEGEKLYDEAQSVVVDVNTKKYVKAPSTVNGYLSGDYNNVKLSWSKSKNASGYFVYMKSADEELYTNLGSTTKRSYTVKDLNDGMKYTFKVVPYYKKNGEKVESYYSKTKTVYTLKKLDAPVVEKYSSKKVRVKWENISGETGYQISRSTKEDGTNIVSTYSTTSGKSKTITATKGKTYYYKVRVYKTVNGKRIYAPWSDVTTFVNE